MAANAVVSQRRIARDRLALDAEEIPGGHLVALSNPSGLADKLIDYAAQLRSGAPALATAPCHLDDATEVD